MSYFKYLLKNKLLWFLAFFALVAAFLFFTDPEPREVKWISIGCGAMMAAFLVGNWIKWKQLQKPKPITDQRKGNFSTGQKGGTVNQRFNEDL